MIKLTLTLIMLASTSNASVIFQQEKIMSEDSRFVGIRDKVKLVQYITPPEDSEPLYEVVNKKDNRVLGFAREDDYCMGGKYSSEFVPCDIEKGFKQDEEYQTISTVSNDDYFGNTKSYFNGGFDLDRGYDSFLPGSKDECIDPPNNPEPIPNVPIPMSSLLLLSAVGFGLLKRNKK